MSHKALVGLCGPEVEDAGEETFLLFSYHHTSQNLGYIDAYSSSIEIDVEGRTMFFRQSPGVLNSKRDAGTTGAVLWKVSPLVAEWMSPKSGPLWEIGILHPAANICELGCGISGLLGLCLAPLVSSYILTDQSYVMRVLQENIAANKTNDPKASRKTGKGQAKRPVSGKLMTLSLDWEKDSASNVQDTLGRGQQVDLVLACDCIYNDSLIKPLMETCVQICEAGSTCGKKTVLLVAQQLRSNEIFEEWLSVSLQFFHVWRLPDDILTKDLKMGSGYVLHIALLKENS